jgi:uncharacterized protein (TIGR02246 family)
MTHRTLISVTIGAALLGTAAMVVTNPSANARPTPARQPASADVRAEIVRMMDSSAAAWNRGDLDGFVSVYAPDTTTTFIGSRGILRGRAAIRGAYAPRFAPGGTRDSLSFEQLEIDELAPNVVNTIAYYRLMRGDSTTSYGPTSLVMRKIGGQWMIIHDHSS